MSTRCTAAIALAVVQLFRAGPARAEPEAAAPAPVLDLANLMNRVEFHEAGLEKIDAAELALLSDWVGRLVVRVLTARLRAGCSPSVESRIAGEFQGWRGRTLVQLENGQVWRQRGTLRSESYRASPVVLIYRTNAGCRMKVDGLADEALVEQLD
ncbi:MAG TPA: hypothetical protein VEL05_02630 [Candidatus Acidoferrum sp.]|nr:hypothetical protein [Candidatus Acidoferrum sp.]